MKRKQTGNRKQETWLWVRRGLEAFPEIIESPGINFLH
jgi:hypothetical protein